MIEERLMAAGVFEVPMGERTPGAVYDRVSEGGYIVVTPGWAPAMSADALLARSMFTGFVRTKSNDGVISGAHVNVLLGSEDGIGDRSATVSDISGSTSRGDLIELLLSRANGITAGTIGDASATGVTLILTQSETVREWLRFLHDPDALSGFQDLRFSAGIFSGTPGEWRVNPDLTFDFAASGMFRDQHVIVGDLPATNGDPVTIPARIRMDPVDISSWAGGAVWRLVGTGIAQSAYTSPYKTLAGTDLQQWVYGETTGALDGTELQAAADALAAQHADVTTRLEIETDRRFLRVDVEPGDYLGVYIPRYNLVGLGNDVTVGGRTIAPNPLRCHMIRWPLQRPMGVYHLTPTDPVEVVDLTRWVAWENQPAELEVAAPSVNLNLAVTLGRL